MSNLQFLMNRLNQSSGVGPMEIAKGKREQEKRNALADILNSQQVAQNDAAIRGTQLDNAQRARQMAQPNQVDPYKQAQIDNLRQQMEMRKQQAGAPKPLTPLQEKMSYELGVSFHDMSPEQRQQAYWLVQHRGSESKGPTFAEKEQIKVDTKRKAELSSNETARLENIRRAQEFLGAFNGEAEALETFDLNSAADSGAGRVAASYFPTFTDQGRFDEELDAFAEQAARAMLSANGDARPTDADVEGAKRAIFGIGKDEEVNKRLLQTFIKQQQSLQSEFDQLDSNPIYNEAEAILNGG